MAEALVSFILDQLAAVPFEIAGRELKLVLDAKKEVKNIQKNLREIRDVLEDAEEKQIVEKNVRSWMDKLKEASYDMEDVLDEWNTFIEKEKEGAPVPKKTVRPFLSCFSFGRQVVKHHDIGRKIVKINQDLDEITKDSERYEFVSRAVTQCRRPEGTTSFITVSFVDVSVIKGRDAIRDEILQKLISTSEKECTQTCSIIGMGGLGKTALAQIVFQHVRDQRSFDKTIWICVSDFFDQTKVAREILDNFGCLSTSSQLSLQVILENISEKIKETKLFLVFDDVWTDRDQDWQALRTVLQNCKPGSRILVTTRKESVVKVMGSSKPNVFHLERLSDEICWDILKQVAFRGREERERADLEDVGMEIAIKCKGLPLAAKTLGSLLEDKSMDGWKEVLSSKFWELKKVKEDIFRPLLLSYYDLPSDIRRCLLYCAIFPKDHVMSRDELILHWKVQGFLNFDDDSKGKECFDYLAKRSFFQDFEKDDSGNIYKCKMHDMIHDFLLFMTKDEIMEDEVKTEASISLDSISKKARHSRITIGQGNTFPRSINGAEKLRSLLTIGHKCVVSHEALKNLFDKAKRLRLLEFGLSTRSSAAVVEQVPEEIGNLVHLRYLSFRFSYDLRLPGTVCKLQNLLYLNLSSCINLSELPDKIEDLVNLKYLYTEACIGLKHYPKGIGKLTGLRRLDRVVARVDCNDPRVFSVGDLENLNNLCGDLQLDMEGDSINGEEVERAKLHNKVRLERLDMTLKTLRGELAEKDMKDELIQVLKPPPRLRPQWK